MTLKSNMSHMPSFHKVEHSTVTSRWICTPISLQVTVAVPRIVNIPCIFWISIAKLWLQKCHILRAPHAHRRAEGVAVTEESVEIENAMIPAPMIRSTSMTKKYWKDKECYKFHKKGHPATHCPKKPSDDDDSSTASAAHSVKKPNNDLKSTKKAFTMVNTQLAQLKEDDSNISES
jgi:hypothetical protein